MCFSATASFSGAAVTGLVGFVTLSRIRAPQEMPLASIPLIFSVQQAMEGALWLGLQRAWPQSYASGFAGVFVFIALAIWPWFIPLAVSLVEESDWRRRLIAVLIPVGIGVGAFSALSLIEHPFHATILRNTICYTGVYPQPLASLLVYALCIFVPLFLATERSLNTLGVIVAGGAIVSALFFYESFISVWCFFAAAASVAVFFAFEHRHALRAQTASGACRS